MGKKIFVTYKYSDSQVKPIAGIYGTTVRHYVDKIDDLLENQYRHVFKGEDDGEDMSTLADSTIGSKLGDKIFDSTVTIVLISKGMKSDLPEKDQWIPWEISYSLKEQSRDGGRSKTNAMLAVVIPDENDSYDYFITSNPLCNSITYHTDNVFQILRDNMFNLKDKESNIRHCNGSKIYLGNPSYITSVKWENFISNADYYIDLALEIRQDIDKYDLKKTVQ